MAAALDEAVSVVPSADALAAREATQSSSVDFLLIFFRHLLPPPFGLAPEGEGTGSLPRFTLLLELCFPMRLHLLFSAMAFVEFVVNGGQPKSALGQPDRMVH
jgi:hypothetical protein